MMIYVITLGFRDQCARCAADNLSIATELRNEPVGVQNAAELCTMWHASSIIIL